MPIIKIDAYPETSPADRMAVGSGMNFYAQADGVTNASPNWRIAAIRGGSFVNPGNGITMTGSHGWIMSFNVIPDITAPMDVDVELAVEDSSGRWTVMKTVYLAPRATVPVPDPVPEPIPDPPQPDPQPDPPPDPPASGHYRGYLIRTTAGFDTGFAVVGLRQPVAVRMTIWQDGQVVDARELVAEYKRPVVRTLVGDLGIRGDWLEFEAAEPFAAKVLWISPAGSGIQYIDAGAS